MHGVRHGGLFSSTVEAILGESPKQPGGKGVATYKRKSRGYLMVLLCSHASPKIGDGPA